MKPGKLNRIVIIAGVAILFALAGLYLRDAVVTNRMVARITAFAPGTTLAEVEATNGPPDRIDEVAGSWKWGRRMRSVPAEVRRVAVYNRTIAPQVVAFLLDEQDRIVEIDHFAGY